MAKRDEGIRGLGPVQKAVLRRFRASSRRTALEVAASMGAYPSAAEAVLESLVARGRLVRAGKRDGVTVYRRANADAASSPPARKPAPAPTPRARATRPAPAMEYEDVHVPGTPLVLRKPVPARAPSRPAPPHEAADLPPAVADWLSGALRDAGDRQLAMETARREGVVMSALRAAAPRRMDLDGLAAATGLDPQDVLLAVKDLSSENPDLASAWTGRGWHAWLRSSEAEVGVAAAREGKRGRR